MLNGLRMNKTPTILALLSSLLVVACTASPNTGDGSGSGSGSGSDSCAALIGSWTGTLGSNASVVALGSTIPITGTLDFMLTHDQNDLPDIVDFTGTATISFEGQTLTQAFEPASAGTGDPEDSHCDGGLQLTGQASTQIGLIDFAVNETVDTSVSPASGSGQFTMKSDKDNGATVHGTGDLTIVKM